MISFIFYNCRQNKYLNTNWIYYIFNFVTIDFNEVYTALPLNLGRHVFTPLLSVPHLKEQCSNDSILLRRFKDIQTQIEHGQSILFINLHSAIYSC